jgi:hypothetical protein
VPNVGWTFNQPAAVAGEPMTIQFTDYNPLPSTWSVFSGPTGMTIDPNTGVLSWTPTLANVGNVTAMIHATDSHGTVNVVVNFPVYFTGAVTVLSATNDSSNINFSWNAPVDNPDSIVGYLITLTWTDANGTTSPPVVYTSSGPGTSYSVAIPVYGPVVYHVTVTALDAAGDLGAPNGQTFDFMLM